jgi:EthD domain-containing protein
MVKAIVLFEGKAPEADRYEQHNRDFSYKIPGATFRHGGVFGAAFGEPKYKYYAEFDFPDMDAFKTATQSEEFAAAGKDASDMGIPFNVYFVEL